MHQTTFLTALVVLLARYHAAAYQITGDWRRDLMPQFLPQRIDVRASGQDLSFCYGSGSICAVGNDLFDDCESLMGSDDLDAWYKCLCTNGYVSVEDACYWCQLAYNLDITYSGPSLTRGCNSASAAIAPIPSSVISKESHYNATYTGTLLGAPTDAGGASASATDSGSGATTAKVTTTAKSTTKNTNTYNGGTTAVQTFNGGDLNGNPTEAADSTSPTVTVTRSPGAVAGGGSNAAAGVDLRGAAIASLAAFALGLVLIL